MNYILCILTSLANAHRYLSKTYEKKNLRKFHLLDSCHSIVAETGVIFSFLLISQILYRTRLEILTREDLEEFVLVR